MQVYEQYAAQDAARWLKHHKPQILARLPGIELDCMIDSLYSGDRFFFKVDRAIVVLGPYIIDDQPDAWLIELGWSNGSCDLDGGEELLWNLLGWVGGRRLVCRPHSPAHRRLYKRHGWVDFENDDKRLMIKWAKGKKNRKRPN